MKRSLIILIAIVAILIGGGVLLVGAHRGEPTNLPVTQSTQQSITTPTIGTPVATPSMIIVNTSTPVVVSVQITDSSLIPNSVNLLLLNATGTPPTILGQLPCNANGTCTAQFTFNEQVLSPIQLEASAAFRGLLKRVISPILQVRVWSLLSDPTARFIAPYPPELYLVNNETSSEVYWLDSSPNGVAIGGTPAAGSKESVSGFRIAISATPYSPTETFNINQYLSFDYPGRNVASVTTTTIGGVPASVITFAEEEGGGHPVAFVYHNGYVCEIDYLSTIYINGFSDQPGLRIFSELLQHFAFPQ